MQNTESLMDLTNENLHKEMNEIPRSQENKQNILKKVFDGWNMNDAEIQKEEFLTMDQIPARYPAFTKGSLKWLRFHGATNGFNRCVRKIGKKCVISVRAFEGWVNEQSA